jgi:hypothetical protein
VLEAIYSLLDNGISVYLAYRDLEGPEDMAPIEALRRVDAGLAERAWRLAREAAGGAQAIEGRLRAVMRFVEFELDVMGPVPSWAGGVTEEEYLQYRNERVYPAVLLAREIGALHLVPVPASYMESAQEAEAAGNVVLRRLGGG